MASLQTFYNDTQILCNLVFTYNYVILYTIEVCELED